MNKGFRLEAIARRGARAWAGVIVATFLAACGSGGGDREFEAREPSGPGDPIPASVELTKSAPSIASDGRQAVRFFATVKDAGNAVIAGVPVAFTASGTGSSMTVVRGTTDATGRAEASLSIDDPSNRTITVTATAANRRASTTVDVVGTTASISGPLSIVVAQPATFQVAVKDASGAPVVGAPVSVTSAQGNPVSVSPANTNALGIVDVVLTPATANADTLSVSAAGAAGVRSIQVSSTLLRFEAPAAAASIVVGSAPVPVSVRLLENGVAQVGASVSFNATRGNIIDSALTNASGVATTTIQSPLAGRSLVTATAPNGTVSTHEVVFVADRAAKLEVQASPSTVGVNLSGSSTESSQIIAIVRDAVDNPVKGARVNFSALDPSAGVGLSQGFALTDDTGRATVNFFPGALPTGTNEIVVTGIIDCGYTVTGVQCAAPSLPPTDETRLTAARRALQIRIGTGNEAFKVPDEPAPVFNEVPYGVLVTDSAGNPVSGVTLSATVVGVDYGKGFWQRIACAGGEPCWTQIVETVPFCLSEDANLNLRLDAGEDLNGDGVLTPASVALSYWGTSGEASTGVSDASGSSVLRIRYLRDRSRWVSVRVRVSASVPDGTEGAETVQFVLPVLGTDLTDQAVPPPGATSPYGRGTCP